MATMTLNLSNPKAVAEAGERIYAERYKAEYESQYPGWFVAIDVVSGIAYPAQNSEDAFALARSKAPTGVFHLIQVGQPGAFRVGFTRHNNGLLAWVNR